MQAKKCVEPFFGNNDASFGKANSVAGTALSGCTSNDVDILEHYDSIHLGNGFMAADVVLSKHVAVEFIKRLSARSGNCKNKLLDENETKGKGVDDVYSNVFALQSIQEACNSKCRAEKCHYQEMIQCCAALLDKLMTSELQRMVMEQCVILLAMPLLQRLMISLLSLQMY